jgi:hypothetical protein
MPIRADRARLVDDSRTFSAEDLTEIWAWLDSLDAQPLRSRDHEQLELSRFIFRPATYAFGQKIYSIARCSDGRELLGSVIGATGPESKWGASGLWSEVSRFSSVMAKSMAPAFGKDL